MTSRSRSRAVRALLVAVVLPAAGSACAQTPPVTPGAAATALTGDRTPILDGVEVAVTSTATCGCCKEWVAYLERSGATVEVTYVDDLATVKDAAGVPDGARSCHTAFVDRYVIEGHVPAEAIADLLRDDLEVAGMALPGMPGGSPGMPGSADGLLEVLVFVDGQVGPYDSY